MPKVRSKDSTKGLRRMKTVKFRVGNRKSGKSAMTMTTEELMKGLENSNLKKYHSNIAHALYLRADPVD